MAKTSREVADRLFPLAPGIGHRVRTAARLVGDYAEAAAASGLTYEQLRKIMNEEAVPNFPSMVALSEKSGCSLVWIALGRPPQLTVDGLSPRTSYSGAEGSAAAGFENPDTVLVRRFDLRFAAGAGAEVDSELVSTALPFSRRYLEQVLRCSVGDVAIGEASGDSMLPTIADRDLVMVNLRKRTISNGAIFVLRQANELVVKRVQREPDGSVLLVSDNKAYDPRRLTQAEADEVDVIGRMIWSGGPV